MSFRICVGLPHIIVSIDKIIAHNQELTPYFLSTNDNLILKIELTINHTPVIIGIIIFNILGYISKIIPNNNDKIPEVIKSENTKEQVDFKIKDIPIIINIKAKK